MLQLKRNLIWEYYRFDLINNTTYYVENQKGSVNSVLCCYSIMKNDCPVIKGSDFIIYTVFDLNSEIL